MATKNKNADAIETHHDDGSVETFDATATLERLAADDSYIVDGAAIVREILTSSTPKGTISKVIKLNPTPTNPSPAIRGVFQGFEPVEITAPGDEGRKQVMNYVLLQPKPGVILKLLGSYQVMQGMASVRIGQTVTIARPNVAPIRTPRGFNVTQFIVIPEGGEAVRGYAVPFGEWGQRFNSGKIPGALAAGETVDNDTGEVR